MKLCYFSTTSFSDCDINLLHHLSDKYEITYGVIIPNKNANYTTDELSSYCKLYNINFIPVYNKYRYRDVRNIKTYLQFINYIKSNDFDIVYINNFDQLYLNLLLSIFINKQRTIIGLHDVINHSGTSANYLLELSKNIIIKNFNNFLTFSKSQASIFKNKWRNKSVHAIPLALKDFGPLLDSTDTEKTNFLFFGNIKSYKGLDVLLRSINRLSSKYDSFTLTIAGRCTEWDELYLPLVKDNTAIKTHIRYIHNHEIPYFFSKTHYLILPYRDTTQSGPLMIAYNYNIPVIASDIDGFKEFIDDSSTGYLFDVDNEFDLDRALEDAINRNSTDYNKLKKRLQDYTNESLSTPAITTKYEKLFNDLIREKTQLYESC